MSLADFTAAPPQVLTLPPCCKCWGRMVLTHIEKASDGVERRTFECPRCNHTGLILVNSK
jgi:hypothetical protein